MPVLVHDGKVVTESTLDWHERVSARPAVKTALSMPNPVAATHDAAAKAWKTT